MELKMDWKQLSDRWFKEEELNDKYWPHQFEFQSWIPVLAAERFCYDNFKSCNWRNRGRYFGFKSKKDYAWFVLRWQ